MDTDTLKKDIDGLTESLNRISWFCGKVSDDLERLSGDLGGEGREPYESGAGKQVDFLNMASGILENAFAEIQEKIQEAIDLDSESMMVEGEPERYYDKVSAHMAGMAEAMNIVREVLKKTE